MFNQIMVLFLDPGDTKKVFIHIHTCYMLPNMRSV